MNDMLEEMLIRIAKEEEIIKTEVGKDYAHLTYADGRKQTLMRMRAWVNMKTMTK